MNFEASVARNLRKADIPFVQNQAVGGLRPDFVLSTEDGKKVVIQAKDLKPSASSLTHAVTQVEYYKQATGAHSAVFVVPKGAKAAPDHGIVSADKLAGWIFSNFGENFSKPAKRKTPPKSVFCAMPFAEKYQDTYLVAMAPAAKANGAVADRLPEKNFEGDIIQEIEKLIKKSSAVFADLSESNPNVMYEVGFAHALDRPTIHMCSTALDTLPFDVRNWNTVAYTLGQTTKLLPILKSRLKTALE